MQRVENDSNICRNRGVCLLDHMRGVLQQNIFLDNNMRKDEGGGEKDGLVLY